MWRRVDNHDLDCDSYHFDGDGEQIIMILVVTVMLGGAPGNLTDMLILTTLKNGNQLCSIEAPGKLPEGRGK